jgi:hypothetical protein
MENLYEEDMSTENIVELAERLKGRFGTHVKVAELLMIRPVSYYAVRTGRANPSRRLVQAMKNLLAQAGV